MERDYYIDDLRLFEEIEEAEKLCSCNRRVKLYKPRQNPLETFTENEFRQKHGFSKSTAVYIVDLIKDELEHDARGGGISPELQILTAIRSWAGAENQDDIGDFAGVSQPQVSRICRKVAVALISKRSDFIKMPQTSEEQEKVMADFFNICGFPNVIGVVDCTHIKVQKIKSSDGLNYVNRKGYSSLNVQVICNANLEIMDIVEHWGGSEQDSRIFHESHIKSRFEKSEFNGRLLGDSNYRSTSYLFTPLLYPSTPKEGAYNFSLIRTRKVIEKCFCTWKQRFRCLQRGFVTNIENTKLFIVALAILHNIGVKRDYIEGDLGVENVEIPGIVYDNRENRACTSFIEEYF